MLSPTNMKNCIVFLLISMTAALPSHAQLTQFQIDSMIQKLTVAKKDSNKVKLLMELGNEVGYTDSKKAMQYAEEGFALSKEIDYKMGIARTAYLIGSTYMEQGQFPQSMKMLQYAESTFVAINEPYRLGMVNTAKGNWHFMQSDYWNASHYYARATEIFDQYKDTAHALMVYQNLVASLDQTKNYEKAVTLAKKVLVVARERNDTLQMAYTLQGLANSLISLNRMEEARSYLNPLLLLVKNTLDYNIAAESYSTAANWHYQRQEYDKAIDYLKQALAKTQNVRDNYQVANYKKSIGAAYLKKGELAPAYQFLTEAATQAKESNNDDVYFHTSLYLSEYYEKINDYRQAFNYLQLYTQLNDSTLSAGTRQYTSQLEAVYESNKKETEILRLKSVQQEKDFALKKRNIYLSIAAGLLILLGVILMLFRKNSKNRQRLSEQKAALQEEKILTMEKREQVASLQSMINGQETERTRIAKDLHDGLGGIFSTVKMHYSTLQQDTPVIRENPLYRKTLDLINNAADELRKVAHNMMPEVLMKVGLVEALRDFCDNISAGRLLKASLQSYGMEHRLSNGTEIMLFRIIQELVNNIIKHAYATEAIIQINRQGNKLSLTIEDNGRGFDTGEAEQKRSMGIATVKSRVDYLNGKLTIDSRKDIGTTVMIDLLLNEN